MEKTILTGITICAVAVFSSTAQNTDGETQAGKVSAKRKNNTINMGLQARDGLNMSNTKVDFKNTVRDVSATGKSRIDTGLQLNKSNVKNSKLNISTTLV